MSETKRSRQIQRDLERLIEPFRVTDGKKFRLAHVNPRDTRGIRSKEQATDYLRFGVEMISALQQKLYAQDRWSVLVIIQAMDAAGKDGVISHVMSGVNPQGCQVYAFKVPSAEELDHDFLWRTTCCLPERGRIGIFNRSYYEEALVVRVHPQILAGQRLPDQLVTKSIWQERFESINAFERHLARNGCAILKFFLHVSKGEQKARFLRRLEQPEKNWKFSMADVREREHWGEYMDAYEDMVRHTASEHAPWHVVPADNKWFTRLVVAATIHQHMSTLGLAFPKVTGDQARELETARRALGAQPDEDDAGKRGGAARGSPAKGHRKRK
jgi:PPK2 family polyphosphate:nucleotide phosphotransferase